MAKYVPDSKTQRWVIIAPGRMKRPADADSASVATLALPKSSAERRSAKGAAVAGRSEDAGGATSLRSTQGKLVCPFCVGNEAITPPEVYRIGGGQKDKPGWEVRVVPNLYPITDIHEVIIHSPSDTDDIEQLPLGHVVKILTAYRDRYRAHEQEGHVLIFCNHGLHAGASLIHPHAQLVVLPKQINLDTLSREPIANVVEENGFVAYCPDFSQWPYEVWIAPKHGGSHFGDTTDAALPDLAGVLKRALGRLQSIYDDPKLAGIHAGIPFGYNFYIYHGINWYIRIIPRFIHRAGFELGTGLNVNVVDPTQASEQLKAIVIS